MALRASSRPFRSFSSAVRLSSRVFLLQKSSLQAFSSCPLVYLKSGSDPKHGRENDKSWSEFRKYFDFPLQTNDQHGFSEGCEVTLRGWLGPARSMSNNLSFAPLLVDGGPTINVVFKWETEGTAEHTALKELKTIPKFSSVSITGKISKIATSQPFGMLRDPRFPPNVSKIDIDASAIQLLNPLPKDIKISRGVQFPPKARHLQIRFDPHLRNRLYFRNYLNHESRKILEELGFCEVETPILFKSTPEGAREFIVPTRRRGFTYALPQSPQQYKQILMASGIPAYYQFARCFRDEDLRSDRQPEFTQLDLERAFATGEDVMSSVEYLVKQLYSRMRESFVLQKVEDGGVVPVRRSNNDGIEAVEYPPVSEAGFPRMTYDDAMRKYGTDKPDLRIKNEIHQIDSIMSSAFVSTITSLKDPIIEACRFQLGGDVDTVRKFVISFMDNLPPTLKHHPNGEPTVLIYDTEKPLSGLSSLGHEAVSALTELDPARPWTQDFCNLEHGDILLMAARPRTPYTGGSTALGTTRNLLYLAAVSAKLLKRDDSFQFLWVHDFPLFTRADETNTEEGQGGSSGFNSTHHPFTAPKTPHDFELLRTDPLSAKADHYDLVLNGVELGGGSRRIHIAKVQEHIMHEILGMSKARIKDFEHLLEALRAGCPPHAGMALGWDRLVATLSGTDSIRDVIAFPKSMKGEDLLAQSPARLTKKQLDTYHLRLLKAEEENGSDTLACNSCTIK